MTYDHGIPHGIRSCRQVGDSFGEVALQTDQPRAATVKTRGDAIFATLLREAPREPWEPDRWDPRDPRDPVGDPSGDLLNGMDMKYIWCIYYMMYILIYPLGISPLMYTNGPMVYSKYIGIVY